MKNIFFVILLVLCSLPINAQVTETNEGNTDLQQSLNTLFQNVNVAQATTGFLINKAVYYTNIQKYNGTIISDSTDVNINTLGWVYAMLHAAKVGNQSLPHPSTLYGNNSYSGNTVPLVVVCQKYNTLKPTIFSNNLISYSNGQLFDVAGRSESPYKEDTVLVVSPVNNKFRNRNISFVLNTDRIVQNLGNIQSYSIDLGTGFQNITLGTSFNLPLSIGMNRPTLRVRLANGRILLCRFEIQIEQNDDAPEGGPDAVYDKNISRREIITADRSFLGGFGTAEVTTFFACSDKVLRKPLLVLDGFNAEAFLDEVTAEGFLEFFNQIARKGSAEKLIATFGAKATTLFSSIGRVKVGVTLSSVMLFCYKLFCGT